MKKNIKEPWLCFPIFSGRRRGVNNPKCMKNWDQAKKETMT